MDAIPALQERANDYQRDYEHLIRQTDDRSLETIRRFIRGVQDRERRGDSPVFDFLFAAQ